MKWHLELSGFLVDKLHRVENEAQGTELEKEALHRENTDNAVGLHNFNRHLRVEVGLEYLVWVLQSISIASPVNNFQECSYWVE